MADILYLSSDGQLLGTLEYNAGIWRLTYAPQWLGNPNAFPLSPHLALRAKPYDDLDEDGMVEKFFDNLLPEGDARLRLEKRLSAKNGDAFDQGTLGRDARDCCRSSSAASGAQAAASLDLRRMKLPFTIPCRF